MGYLDVFGFYVADDLAPVTGFAGHLTEHALVSVVAGVGVGDLDDLGFDALEFVVEELQARSVLLDVPLADLAVDGSCDAFDESGLE